MKIFIFNQIGCDLRASFNFKDEKQGVFCADHKKAGMICVTVEKCQETGCDTFPVFNFKGEKRRLFCFAHKKEGMINIKVKNVRKSDVIHFLLLIL